MRGLCNAASEGVFFSERPPDFKTCPFRPTGDWEPGTDTKRAGCPSHVPSAPGCPVRARVAGRWPPPSAERGLSKPKCGLFYGISRPCLFPRAAPRAPIGPVARACPPYIPGASGSPRYAGTPDLCPPAQHKIESLLMYINLQRRKTRYAVAVYRCAQLFLWKLNAVSLLADQSVDLQNDQCHVLTIRLEPACLLQKYV